MDVAIADHFPADGDDPAVHLGRGGTGIGRPGSRLTLSPGPDTVMGHAGESYETFNHGPQYMGDFEFVAPVRSAPNYDDRIQTPMVSR